MIFSANFWKQATERAVKTFAQFFVTLASAGALNVFTMDWPTVLGLSLGGTLLSFATSVVTASVTKTDSASLVVEAK